MPQPIHIDLRRDLPKVREEGGAPRPLRRDPSVVAVAARKLAERCLEYDEGGNLDDWIEALTAEVGSWGDGYKLARELERWHYIQPNRDIVEALDDSYWLLSDAHTEALKAWVKETGWTPRFTVGDRVACRIGLGKVNQIDAATGVYYFAPDSEPEKYRNGGGYLLAEEDLTPEPASAETPNG